MVKNMAGKDKKTENTDNTVETDESIFSDIDLTEIVKTTNLDIKPKYDLIPKGDLLTIRNVSIVSLPKYKLVIVDGAEMNLMFMELNDNGIIYSLPCSSVALRRSIVAIAIRLCGAKTQAEIDISKVIGTQLCIKREQFTAKGFTQSPLKFFLKE